MTNDNNNNNKLSIYPIDKNNSLYTDIDDTLGEDKTRVEINEAFLPPENLAYIAGYLEAHSTFDFNLRKRKEEGERYKLKMGVRHHSPHRFIFDILSCLFAGNIAPTRTGWRIMYGNQATYEICKALSPYFYVQKELCNEIIRVYEEKNWEGYAGKHIKRDLRNKTYFEKLKQIKTNQINISEYKIPHLNNHLIKWYLGGFLDANATFSAYPVKNKASIMTEIKVCSKKKIIPLICQKLLNLDNNAVSFDKKDGVFTLSIRGVKTQRKIINYYSNYIYSCAEKLKTLKIFLLLRDRGKQLTTAQLEQKNKLTSLYKEMNTFRLCKKCKIFYPTNMFRQKRGTEIYRCPTCEKKNLKEYYINNHVSCKNSVKQYKENLYKTSAGVVKIILTNLKKRLRKYDKSAPPMSDLLGCSEYKFKVYLKKKFTANMSWKNYGTYWVLDHIHPCADFNLTDSEEQKICFHYTNFQPLTWEHNTEKSSKLNWTPPVVNG